MIALAAIHLAHSPLAQSTEETSGSVVVAVGALLIVVVVLFLGVAWARKRLNPNEDFHGEGFGLSDLRQLHKEGKLTDEEFERARAKMVESMHAAQARRDAAKAEAAKDRVQRSELRGR